MVLDIICHPVICLRDDVSETVFCLLMWVQQNRRVLHQYRTIDNAQN
jgi:hypothetical protein